MRSYDLMHSKTSVDGLAHKLIPICFWCIVLSLLAPEVLSVLREYIRRLLLRVLLHILLRGPFHIHVLALLSCA